MVSSEARSPVWTASSIQAWSRRPVRVDRSGAARRASVSVAVRNVTIVWSARLGGMARTRSMSAACSGWRRAAKLNREWIAASRALRVRIVLPRSRSMWSRNALITGASRSVNKPAWHGAGALGGEAKQQPDGIPVGGDRVRAGAPLGDQPLGEERLHGGGDRGHRGAPGAAEPAGGFGEQSGEALRYQYVSAGVRGRGRPIAAASGRRCRRRRSTSPAGWQPRRNAANRAAGDGSRRIGRPVGRAGQAW